MANKKRKVTYEENANNDGKSVEMTEEHSENDSLTEQDDERYTPAANN